MMRSSLDSVEINRAIIRIVHGETDYCISHFYLITSQLPMGWSDRDERKGNGEHGRKTNRYPDEILIATKDVVRRLSLEDRRRSSNVEQTCLPR